MMERVISPKVLQYPSTYRRCRGARMNPKHLDILSDMIGRNDVVDFDWLKLCPSSKFAVAPILNIKTFIIRKSFAMNVVVSCSTIVNRVMCGNHGESSKYNMF
jgi:hypothetical protein